VCFRPPSKPNQNLPKSSQARTKTSKGNQRKRPGFTWIPLAELSFFKGLQRPLGPKDLFSDPFLAAGLRVKPCFIWLLGQGTMISDFRKENSCRMDKRLAGRGLHARRQIGQAAAAGEDIVELAKQESA
jgi:hypothetical protein